MKWARNALLGALLSSPVLAAAPSLCDLYTTALLKNNTAANQYTLLTLVVNTALIGNYTQPNHNAVTGILVPGQYNGKNVTLLPYFNGGFISTNRGKSPSAMNFLDGGGAIPLAENMPASDTTSNQYKLVTHLYGYFGTLLGCSMIGQTGFPAYGGSTSMYETHKFMDLGPDEMGYFIQEVGLSASSFGVSAANVTYIAMALDNTFNMRCSPKVALPPTAAPDFQAICLQAACATPTMGAVCESYNHNHGEGVLPATATSTIGPQLTDLAPQLSSIDAGLVTPGMGSMTSSMSGSGSGSMMSTSAAPKPTTIQTVETSVITSGSSTITSLITSSIVSTPSAGAAPMQTAAIGVMAMVGAAGLVGQMI